MAPETAAFAHSLQQRTASQPASQQHPPPYAEHWLWPWILCWTPKS